MKATAADGHKSWVIVHCNQMLHAGRRQSVQFLIFWRNVKRMIWSTYGISHWHFAFLQFIMRHLGTFLKNVEWSTRTTPPSYFRSLVMLAIMLQTSHRYVWKKDSNDRQHNSLRLTYRTSSFNSNADLNTSYRRCLEIVWYLTLSGNINAHCCSLYALSATNLYNYYHASPLSSYIDRLGVFYLLLPTFFGGRVAAFIMHQ